MKFRLLLSIIAIMSMIITSACSSSSVNTPEDKAGDSKEVIRFGVGPVLPTPEETREAFTPFFAHLAKELGYKDFELKETTDWAGIEVALASEQVDVAWLGPWGYVLAHDRDPGINAIATVKYDNNPYYHAIMIAKPNSGIKNFPEDAKGMSLSLADTGSTSGWLIPSYYFKKWGIDPQTYFSEFREGATHVANEMAVIEGHIDLASDFNRHRNALIESGKITADSSEVVWESDPLPNDAIAVRAGVDPDVVKQIQDILVNLTEEQAKELLPEHYTGFIAADHSSYKLIEDAGIEVGRIKKK